VASTTLPGARPRQTIRRFGRHAQNDVDFFLFRLRADDHNFCAGQLVPMRETENFD
jgi:hypothetical protein